MNRTAYAVAFVVVLASLSSCSQESSPERNRPRSVGGDPSLGDAAGDNPVSADGNADDEVAQSDLEGDAAAGGDANATDAEPSMTTWEYDFMVAGNGTAVQASDWFFDGGNVAETALGFFMNQTDLAAPYLFTGDFTAEFEFYLKILSDENIYRHAFRLIDPNWASSSNRRFAGFASYYAATPTHEDAYYQVDQGNGSYNVSDLPGNPPGFVANSVSRCTLTKAGNNLTIRLNDTLVSEITINPSNTPSIGYAPLIHGHNSWDQADSNFYLRKLTVTYLSTERIAYDWTP